MNSSTLVVSVDIVDKMDEPSRAKIFWSESWWTNHCSWMHACESAEACWVDSTFDELLSRVASFYVLEGLERPFYCVRPSELIRRLRFKISPSLVVLTTLSDRYNG